MRLDFIVIHLIRLVDVDLFERKILLIGWCQVAGDDLL
jgi:hypothetical protein